MDSKILQEAALSYLAVYDEELRDKLEECGMIQSEDSGYYVDEAREPAVTMPRKQHESFDFYDLVLHHLISEGYADSVDSAEAIMANMSEDWVLDIVEEFIDEDSRRMSNRQHAERVRGNIRSFSGSKSIEYTPPSNWDPEANRGKGAVLTRKQIEKKRRKNLRNSD